jgi:hypothetical protein
MTTTPWKASDQTGAKYLGPIEFQDETKGDWHIFEIIALPDRVCFGGGCNAGFLESGYILRDACESLDETLSEMRSDLETYYNNGPRYVSRIVCNERM